jgi:hypothetical protein
MSDSGRCLTDRFHLTLGGSTGQAYRPVRVDAPEWGVMGSPNEVGEALGTTRSATPIPGTQRRRHRVACLPGEIRRPGCWTAL